MEPMEFWLGMLLLVAVVVIPALAITLRISLKPTVEALLRLRDGLSHQPGSEALTERVEALEAAVAELQSDFRRLSEAEAFHARLSSGRTKSDEGDAAERESPRRHPHDPDDR